MTPRRHSRAEPGSERRHDRRLRLAGEVLATVQTAFIAKIIDFAIGGALIDVGYALKPGGACILGLTLPGDRLLKVPGHVVRSTLHAFKAARTGETVAHYRVAVAFDSLSDPQRTGVEQLLLDFAGELDAEMAAEVDPAEVPGEDMGIELEADLPPGAELDEALADDRSK